MNETCLHERRYLIERTNGVHKKEMCKACGEILLSPEPKTDPEVKVDSGDGGIQLPSGSHGN